MSKTISKRWRWLLSGLALSLALVVSSYFSDKSQSANTKVEITDKVHYAKKHQDPKATRMQKIALDQLERSRGLGRVNDVFRPKSWYVPPPPPPPPKALSPPPPMAPPLPFSFLGKVKKTDGKLTIIIAKMGHVFLVHGGETLDNEYHVDGIENGELAFTYLPMKKKQYLKLSGGQ